MATNLPFLEQISKKAINSFLKIQVSMNIKIPHFRTHLNEEVHHACRWSEHHLRRGKQEYNFAGLHSSEYSDCGYVILYVQMKRKCRFHHQGWSNNGENVATLCVYGIQKFGYSEVRKRREGRAQYEPIRKVNRYKHNCPVQDNLDNKGTSKWNYEKVPFCTVQHLSLSH